MRSSSIIPERRALAAVREPGGVDRRARRVPQRGARRRAVARRGGARRSARGRGVAPPRRRHDVHAVGRAPVRALRRRGAERRHAARRRAPRADRGVRGRRLGEGHAPPRVRGDHRRPGRHERCERDDRGVDERLAGRRARGPRAAGALGIGLAAGARPRADRRVGHEAAATATSAASIVAEVDAACSRPRTPHRGPTFVDIPLDAFGPAIVELPAVGRRRVRAERRRRRDRAGRRAGRRGGAAGAGRGRRRVLGAGRGRDARVRRAGAGARRS